MLETVLTPILIGFMSFRLMNLADEMQSHFAAEARSHLSSHRRLFLSRIASSALCYIISRVGIRMYGNVAVLRDSFFQYTTASIKACTHSTVSS